MDNKELYNLGLKIIKDCDRKINKARKFNILAINMSEQEQEQLLPLFGIAYHFDYMPEPVNKNGKLETEIVKKFNASCLFDIYRNEDYEHLKKTFLINKSRYDFAQKLDKELPVKTECLPVKKFKI